MIIVDDGLALAVAAGRRDGVTRLAEDDEVCTTWGFHYRLVRALRDGRQAGKLSATVSGAAIDRVVAPPPDRLRILDPRVLTDLAATMAARHNLNVLAAELVAAAAEHRAMVVVSTQNVGRRWPEVFAAERLVLERA